MDYLNAWNKISAESIDFLLKNEAIRNAVLHKGNDMLYEHLVVKNEDNRPPAIQEARVKLLQNLMHTLKDAIADGRISSQVRKALIGNFGVHTLPSLREANRCFIATATRLFSTSWKTTRTIIS